MTWEFLGSQLNSVRTHLATLSSGLDSTRQEIGEHCARIRAQVDAQADEMLRRISEDHARLLAAIDQYEQEALVAFEASRRKREVDALIREATEFANRQSADTVPAGENTLVDELSRANAYLDKLHYKLLMDKSENLVSRLNG
jgi:hypothetical protein